MPRSKRSGKKVTPATVKAATAKILADAELARRVRAVERRNRPLDHSDRKYSERASVERTNAPMPVAESQVITRRRAVLGNIDRLPFSSVAGFIVNGDGTNTTQSQLYVQPSRMAVANKSIGCPLAIADTNYGSSGWFNVLIQFARCGFRRVSAVIEPIGAGASTTAGATIVVAPLMGGLVQTVSYVTSTAALTAISAATLRSSDGAVEFPAYKSVRIPLDRFLGGMDSRGTFGIPSLASVNGAGSTQALANAVTVPVGLLIAGVCPVGLAANTQLATITFEGEVSMYDFQNALVWGSPVGLPVPARSDEKELPPRSVLADRGQNPSPPDDRGWVLTPAAARRGDPKWEDMALGRASEFGSVKPPSDVPNSGKAAR